MRPNTGIEQKLCYNEGTLSELYQRNLEDAKALLSKLEVFCGNDCNIGGLSGWVFEQTVQYCLRQELAALGLHPSITEQCGLGGKAKADLAVGCLAVEIKLKGLFGSDQVERYGRYRQAANGRGLQYLFITKEESHGPYWQGIQKTLGTESTFFLDVSGEWKRFVTRIVAELQNYQE